MKQHEGEFFRNRKHVTTASLDVYDVYDDLTLSGLQHPWVWLDKVNLQQTGPGSGPGSP